jgi:hypothetical protein
MTEYKKPIKEGGSFDRDHDANDIKNLEADIKRIE